MDIIFQSGDFYNQSNFWSSIVMPFLGFFIPAIIAVILFNIGIKKERELDRERRLFEKKEEENKIKTKILNFTDHYIILLNSCIEASKRQLNSYSNFVEKIKKNDYGGYVFQRFTLEELTRITGYTSERVFEVFEMKGLTSIYTKTIQEIDFLTSIFKEIPKTYSISEGKLIRELSDKVFILREEILYELVCTIKNGQRNGKTYANDSVMEFYNKILQNYHRIKGPESSIQYEYENLLLPLSNELRKEKYLNIEGIDLFLKKLREGRNYVATIQSLNKIIHDQVLDSCKYIQSSINFLEESHSKLTT